MSDLFLQKHFRVKLNTVIYAIKENILFLNGLSTTEHKTLLDELTKQIDKIEKNNIKLEHALADYSKSENSDYSNRNIQYLDPYTTYKNKMNQTTVHKHGENLAPDQEYLARTARTEFRSYSLSVSWFLKELIENMEVNEDFSKLFIISSGHSSANILPQIKNMIYNFENSLEIELESKKSDLMQELNKEEKNYLEIIKKLFSFLKTIFISVGIIKDKDLDSVHLISETIKSHYRPIPGKD